MKTYPLGDQKHNSCVTTISCQIWRLSLKKHRIILPIHVPVQDTSVMTSSTTHFAPEIHLNYRMPTPLLHSLQYCSENQQCFILYFHVGPMPIQATAVFKLPGFKNFFLKHFFFSLSSHISTLATVRIQITPLDFNRLHNRNYDVSLKHIPQSMCNYFKKFS